MSSWPPTLVDWPRVTPAVRDGDYLCVTHGVVTAERTRNGLAICPTCRQLLSRAQRNSDGLLETFVESSPTHCAGPQRHPITGGAVLVMWSSCRCANAVPGPGGHRSWRCLACAPEAGQTVGTVTWPPCGHPPEPGG